MKDFETYIMRHYVHATDGDIGNVQPLGLQLESSIHAHYCREPYWPAEKRPAETSRQRA